MVEERGEPLLPVAACCVTYSLERTGRACPALRPGRVLLVRVPLGQPPSLHPLRRAGLRCVRMPLRYYGVVRLPTSVHRRRASLDFPARPATPSDLQAVVGSPGSRARCFRACSRSLTAQGPCLSRASDRPGVAFHLAHSVGTLNFNAISRLNTRPARAPVNASPPPCGRPTHDSGSVWVATPSPYDSFLRYTSPVLTGAFGQSHINVPEGAGAFCRWAGPFAETHSHTIRLSPLVTAKCGAPTP